LSHRKSHEEEMTSILKECQVYARMSPDDKADLI